MDVFDDEIYFDSYDEFKEWLYHEYGNVCEFIGPTIWVKRYHKFTRNWSICGRSSCGGVIYRRKPGSKNR